MIVNVYIPDHAGHLLERIKGICDRQQRSLSYIVREALEAYLASDAKAPATPHPRRWKRERKTHER